MVWLVVCAALLVVAVWYARSVLRAGRARGSADNAQAALDLHHLAFLAGGPARAADVALLTAWARAAVTITPDGRVAPGAQPAADPIGAAVDSAVRAAGATATVAGARLTIADAPAVRALRDRLFGMGVLNPAVHTAGRTRARIVLWIIPVIAIAGLFVEGLSGSPSDDKALWWSNLGAVVVVTIACLTLLFFLFTRYDKLRAPLNDSSLFHLWNMVRDQDAVRRAGDAVHGGHGLGEVALFGHGRITDATLREVFRQAARVTAGQITSDGWTEQQWQAAVDSRGPLDGPTYADAYQANVVQQGQGQPGHQQVPGVPPQQQPPQPQQGYPGPGIYGGGAAAYPPEQRPPWESHPNA